MDWRVGKGGSMKLAYRCVYSRCLARAGRVLSVALCRSPVEGNWHHRAASEWMARGIVDLRRGSRGVQLENRLTRGNIHLVLARMMVLFEASSAGDMQTRGSLGFVEYVQTDCTGDLVYQRRGEQFAFVTGSGVERNVVEFHHRSIQCGR